MKLQVELDRAARKERKAAKKKAAHDFAATVNQQSQGVGAGCLWGLILLAGICFCVWLWFSPKAWYEVRYGVSADHVFLDPKPHDCEFMKAPIGNKYCHFEKIVAVLPQGSTNPTDVYVSWEKVDDQ